MNHNVLAKYQFLFSSMMATVFLFTSPGIHLSQANAQDNPTSKITSVEVISPSLSIQHLALRDGKDILGYVINGPSKLPAEFEAEYQASIVATPKAGTLTNFPSYKWVYGDAAVSAAMIVGYYDRHGYPNMYTGPTNGGVMPLTDTSWPTWSDGSVTYPNNPLVASHKGVDGRTIKGSIDDYWVEYGSSVDDPYLAGAWTHHTWGSAVGDYMKTSQSAYGNVDGSTIFYNNKTLPAKLTCNEIYSLDLFNFDGTYGRKLFYEQRGYTVTDCYNQKTDNQVAGGFSLANFQSEIDAGHPVLLNLTGKSIVGYGYDGSTIFIRDTTSSNTAFTLKMTWGELFNGMELLSVSVVNLSAPAPIPVPSPVAPGGTIIETTPTYKWSKVNNATQYKLRLYKGTAATPLYTKLITTPNCPTTLCTKTPVEELAPASYKWQVQAMVGGGWSAWSVKKSFTVAAPIPIPLAPTGTITNKTPTYKWSKVSNATMYEFRVYKGTSTTPLYKNLITTPVCTSSTCTNTPATRLALADYKWQVRAFVGGVWKPWSARKAFTVAAR